MSNSTNDNTLSRDARRLLDYLWSRDATGPEMAITQDVVARELCLPRRQIPELTRELLEAASRDLSATRGYAPVCRCHPPYGLFLSANPDDLRDYDRQLGHRAIETLIRRRLLRRVARSLAESAASRPPGVLPDGQMLLLGAPSLPGVGDTTTPTAIGATP